MNNARFFIHITGSKNYKYRKTNYSEQELIYYLEILPNLRESAIIKRSAGTNG